MIKRLKRSPAKEATSSKINEDIETFSESSLRLFDEGTLSDVTLVVGDQKEEIKAHKFVLVSRSEVFRAMFCGNYIENSGNVEIPDIQPDILKTLLRYMYSGSFEEPTEDRVVCLLYAAEKYGVRGFANKCDLYLQKILSVDNFCTILNMATLFNNKALLKECHFLASVEGKRIIQCRGFLSLTLDSLHVLLKSDYLDASEGSIFRACIRWGEHECEKKKIEKSPENVRKCIDSVLKLIRFTSMSIESFSAEVSKKNILTAEEKVALFQSFVDSSTEYKEFGFTSARHRHSAKHVLLVHNDDGVYDLDGHEDFIELSVNKDTVLVYVDFVIPEKELTTTNRYRGNVEFCIRDDTEILHTQTNVVLDSNSETAGFNLRPCFTLKANKKYILSLTFQERAVLLGREGIDDIVYHRGFELEIKKGTLQDNTSLRLESFEDALSCFNSLFFCNGKEKKSELE